MNNFFYISKTIQDLSIEHLRIIHGLNASLALTVFAKICELIFIFIFSFAQWFEVLIAI